MKFPTIIHQSWYPFLENLFEDNRMTFIKKKLVTIKFCPEPVNIFKVFSMPFSDVRVIIVGLSPYQRKGYATGLAFAVPDKDHDTPSLKSIRDELSRSEHNLYVDEEFDYTLEKWHNQGVFLLNKALTVGLDGDARGHILPSSGWAGWLWFTGEVLKILSENKTGLIFCLWGNDAKEMKKYINPEIHYIMEAPHPVAQVYAASRFKVIPDYLRFTGCGHFEKINEILYHVNKEKIQWV